MVYRRDYFLIFSSIICCVVGQLLLKSGMKTFGELTPRMMFSFNMLFRIFTNPFVFGGLVVYLVSLCVWLIVLTRVDLSFAYPMLGLNYVLILFFSWLVLGEHVTLIRITGVVLIFFGVVLISRDKHKPAEG